MVERAGRLASSNERLATTRRKAPVALASAPALALAAQAQRLFPERPVRTIVPFGPGTLTDTFARVVPASIVGAPGQPIVVEKRPGANAIVGVETAARATPDGYKALLGTDQAMAVNRAARQDVPERDEQPEMRARLGQ